jgi:hypothetical protein
MSMFYCHAHDEMEDSDFVGHEMDREGHEFCEDGYAETYDSDNTVDESMDGDHESALESVYGPMDEGQYDNDF